LKKQAARLRIRNKIRHLLVEDPAAAAAHNGVIGIITATDLARYFKKRMKETTIASEVREDDEKAKEQQPVQREPSLEVLLSEVWELYF
jgi:CBS domain-containing protein